MLTRLALPFTACIAVALIPAAFYTVWILSWAPYGLDLTDEGYYLNWISNPFDYQVSSTQFGFFYHYLFHPLDGSVVAMRAANLLLTLGLGVALMYQLLIGIRQTSKGERILAAALAYPLAFAGLLCSASQRPTPSYNWLNLQGLLLVAIALVVIRRQTLRSDVGACLLLATGGWMCFLAKAPSAGLLAIAVSAYLLATRQVTLRRTLLTAALTAALITATVLSIDGSIATFVERLDMAMKGSAILDPRYNWVEMFRLGWPNLPLVEKLSLFLMSLIVGACTLLYLAKDDRMLAAGLIGAVAVACMPFIMWVGANGLYPATWRFGYELQSSAAAIGLTAALVMSALLGKLNRPNLDGVSMAILLFLFPYFYSFGTNNNYWKIAGFAAIFWIAGAVSLAGNMLPQGTRGLASLVPTAVATSAISMSVLLIGAEYPYRQPEPLKLQRDSVKVGVKESELVVDAELARYLSTVSGASKSAGFRIGTPMVDLTGRSPGALYALGAKPIGQPWMIGGYPGSEELADLMLAKAPCRDLAEAWLLEEAEGPRPLSRAILRDSHLHYERVAAFTSIRGGYDKTFEQMLMRPTHDIPEAIRRCEARAR